MRVLYIFQTGTLPLAIDLFIWRIGENGKAFGSLSLRLLKRWPPILRDAGPGYIHERKHTMGIGGSVVEGKISPPGVSANDPAVIAKGGAERLKIAQTRCVVVGWYGC